jgi:hypothetical protein
MTSDDIAYVRDYIESRKLSDPHWRGEALNALSRVAAVAEDEGYWRRVAEETADNLHAAIRRRDARIEELTNDPHAWLRRRGARIKELEGPVAERCACRRTCMKQDGCRIR